jgi:hypothetical protein
MLWWLVIIFWAFILLANLAKFVHKKVLLRHGNLYVIFCSGKTGVLSAFKPELC